MLRADLASAFACLQRLVPEAADRVELLTFDGDRLLASRLADAAQDDAPGRQRETAVDPARSLALLAMLPRELARQALAARQAAWLSRLPLTQAQGFGLAAGELPAAGTWVSAGIPGTRNALSLHVAEGATRDELHLVGRDLTEAARLASGAASASTMSIAVMTRPDDQVEAGLRCVHEAGALLGEGPVWNPASKTLDWVDVLQPAVWSHDPATGGNRCWPVSRLATAVLPASDASRLVLGQGGLARLDTSSGMLQPLFDPEADRETHRFNDAKCDSRGRIWSGSMRLDASEPDGALFCFDGLASARRVDAGFLVSNGMGWSPDDRTMYFTDTGSGTVFAYDFDAERGAVRNRRVFVRLPPAEGRPDGLAVDASGYVWIALWDGWRVVRYAPDGRFDREIIMPVPRPTSCCFGGDDLRTLYVTSARIRLSRDALAAAPQSGGLFAVRVDTPGMGTVLARA
jgi:sugar lactone lactonase YvrE